MKRSKAPSALAAKKVRTDDAGPAQTQASVKPPPSKPLPSKPITKTESKDVGELDNETVPADIDTNTNISNTTTNTNTNTNQPKSTSGSFKTPFKSPINATKTTAIAKKKLEEANAEPTESTIYTVLWCNFSTKKHKSWNDGVLLITGTKCVLKDMEGKDLGKTATYTKKTLDELGEGNTLRVAGKEIEVLKRIPEEEYNSGKIFLSNQTAPSAPKLTSSKKVTSTKFKSHASGEGEKEVTELQPRHDPDAEGAIVCFRPRSPFDSSGKPQVAVVVDPHVAQHLRPHQRQGVKFMYNCVMGGNAEGTGCILADEMGLGKTLQSIALIWTLLKQGPNGQPTTKKVVVITPASLIDNWSKEIRRWLGSERLKHVSVSESTKNAKELISTFIQTPVQPLLLITYEQCRNNMVLMEQIPCGLVVCDEGHRIKNAQSKTAISIAKIRTTRRVILSGTPLQNDLEEFYCMADFCNPGALGPLNSFKKLFVQTITTGRYPNAKPEERKVGQARSKQLTEMTSRFILRRKATILEKYLPPKVEQVVFCKMAELQVQFYKHFLRSKVMTACLSGQTDAYALECVTSLKKLTNHPSLIWNSSHGLDENGEVTDRKYGFDGCAALFPSDFDPKLPQPEYSGKIKVLDTLLKTIKATTKDKVVLVSNSKKTLNIFQNMCTHSNYTFVRLDGDLAVPQRQKLVDKFNTPNSDIFIFLLSSRAGGVGLNLIGGNRLVLFDPDWNPATDRQAMARIWRDGQTKPVWIYRFLSVGTIDEKIYQRQIMKQGLSNSVVDDEVNSKRHFKSEDLKNIFSLNTNTNCDTHDLIKCNCLTGEKQTPAEIDEQAKKSEISSWLHFKSPEKYVDMLLKTVAEEKESPISFVFCSPPLIPKTEEKEEDIVNEAAREDIYMNTEEHKENEETEENKENEESANGVEENTEEVKEKPKRGKKKEEDVVSEKPEPPKRGRAKQEESPSAKKKTARRRRVDSDDDEDFVVQEEPEKETPPVAAEIPPPTPPSDNGTVKVRGRLVKKVVEEEDDIDMLELED